MSNSRTLKCREVEFTISEFGNGIVNFEAEEDGYELIEGKVWVRITPEEAEELAEVLYGYAYAARAKSEEE